MTADSTLSTGVLYPADLSGSEEQYLIRSDFSIRFEKLLLAWRTGKQHGVKSILDIGSMNALLYRFLVANQLGPIEYHAIDIDNANVLACQEAGYECKQCDLNLGGIPYPSGKFDDVIAFEVIEHVPFYHNMFAEVARVLRPGGCMYITTPNVCALGSRVDFVLGRDPHQVYTPTQKDVHYRMYTMASVKKLMAFHNLECIHAEILLSRKSWKTRWLKRVFPNLGDIIFCVGEKR